ncbi:MAG: pilus assembly protein TadG-related protein [Alphaproteobacteria bacterium]
MRTPRHFLRDEHASALMITALALIVLFAAVGIGVDLGRQQLLRARMQQASDAAALAAASLPTGAQAEPVADRYFALNFPTAYMGFTPTTPTFHQDTTISVSTQGTMNTTLMNVAGTHSVNAGGMSVVDPGLGTVVQKYHLVLTMDNSYSMTVADVGASTNIREADLVTQSAQGGHCRAFWDPLFPASCGGNAGADQFCAAVDVNCPALGLTVPPTDAAHADGTTGASRLNALRFAASTISQQLLAPPNSAGSDVAATRWSDQTLGIPLSFTTNLDTVQQYLDAMFSPPEDGATNSTAGLTSATNLLQPVLQDCGTTAVCAVVLITDGMNTAAGPMPYPATTDGFGCNGSDYCSQTVTNSLPVCEQLKNNHVLVYTIAFGQDVNTGPQATNAQAFLSQCASGTVGSNQGQFFFIAPDADKLDDAFAAIVTSIHKVRIVQ